MKVTKIIKPRRWYLEQYDLDNLRVVRGKDNGDAPKKHPKHHTFYGPYGTKEAAYKAGLKW